MLALYILSSQVVNLDERSVSFSSCFSVLILVLSSFASIELMPLVMYFMSFQKKSRSGLVTEVEVREVGRIGGAIESVPMEDEGSDSVLLDRDIVRNMYWLGFLGYLYIIDF